MVFERPTPPQKKKDRQGWGFSGVQGHEKQEKKKFKETSAECELSEVAAQLN